MEIAAGISIAVAWLIVAILYYRAKVLYATIFFVLWVVCGIVLFGLVSLIDLFFGSHY